MDKRAFALPSLLIIGVFIFFANTVINNAIDKGTRDEFIGQAQLNTLDTLIGNIKFKEQSFALTTRLAAWQTLRDSTVKSNCNPYYGRPLLGDCAVIDDISYNWEDKPVKISSFSIENGVSIFASSGQFEKIEDSIKVKNVDKEYGIQTGSFIDAEFIIQLPGMTDAVANLFAESPDCAANVPPETCPGSVETDSWIVEAVSPISGLTPVDKYIFHIVEQLKQCAQQSNCICNFQYPSATVLNIDEADFINKIIQKENKITIERAIDNLALNVKGNTYDLDKANMMVRLSSDEPIQSLDIVPSNAPLFKWNNAVTENSFQAQERLEMKDDSIIFLPKDATATLPVCLVQPSQYVLKLTSKKLYPPDATPLEFYIAAKSTP